MVADRAAALRDEARFRALSRAQKLAALNGEVLRGRSRNVRGC
jgi:hypothetical protein